MKSASFFKRLVCDKSLSRWFLVVKSKFEFVLVFKTGLEMFENLF